jgi:ketosteroid isomerase-like protein
MAKKPSKSRHAVKKAAPKKAPGRNVKPAKAVAAQHNDDNLAFLKDYYKKWGETKGGNFDEIIQNLADDVVWRSIANGLQGLNFAKEPLTKPAVRGYFENLFRDWELVFFDVERFIGQGNSVVVLAECSFRHRRTGKSFMSPKADVWDFRRGKVVGFCEFFDTASAIRSAL